MKKLLFGLFMLGAIYTSAQEIDIKKGKILFDKKEIGLVDGKKRVYTFSDLQNKPLFSIKYNLESLPNGEVRKWYTIIDLSTNESNEFITEELGSSLSLEKNTVKTFTEGEYKILKTNGVDQEVIKQLVSTNKKDYTADFKTELEAIKKLEADALKITGENSINVDKKGNIISTKNNENKFIGTIKISKNGYANTYEIVENNGLIVGKWSDNKLILENGKKFSLKESTNPLANPTAPSSKENDFLNTMVGYALLEGYTLENQLYNKKLEQKNNAIQENQEAVENQINENKLNSSNLYDVPGYLIDEKGNKVIGKLLINFEGVKQGIKEGNVQELPENMGKSVFVKALNEKGKEKSTRYKSNTGAKFCTDAGECYIGLKTIGNAFNSVGNIMSLSADFSYFYKILSENKGYLILEEPASNKLYLKIPQQEKALYLGNSNDDKLEKNFNEYIKCNLNFADFDLKTVDGLKTLIEKHQTTCK